VRPRPGRLGPWVKAGAWPLGAYPPPSPDLLLSAAMGDVGANLVGGALHVGFHCPTLLLPCWCWWEPRWLQRAKSEGVVVVWALK
jgi:hypothetical protein